METMESQLEKAEGQLEEARRTETSYTWEQVSLLPNRSQLTSGAGLANFAVVRPSKDLVKQKVSPQLAQLDPRIPSATRFSAKVGDVPFARVKGLITDMIAAPR